MVGRGARKRTLERAPSPGPDGPSHGAAASRIGNRHRGRLARLPPSAAVTGGRARSGRVCVTLAPSVDGQTDRSTTVAHRCRRRPRNLPPPKPRPSLLMTLAGWLRGRIVHLRGRGYLVASQGRCSPEVACERATCAPDELNPRAERLRGFDGRVAADGELRISDARRFNRLELVLGGSTVSFIFCPVGILSISFYRFVSRGEGAFMLLYRSRDGL